MNLIDKYFELQDKMDSSILSELGSISLVVFSVSLIAIAIHLHWYDDVTVKEYPMKRTSRIIILIPLGFSIMGLILCLHEIEYYNNELESLEEQILASFEKTVEVKTTDIVNSIPIESYFCPHVELKDTETCAYLEFVSDREITQLFIPLKESVYANTKQGLKISYLDLTKQEREFLSEYMNVDRIAISRKHTLHENGWSLGVEVKKEAIHNK